VFPNFPQNLAHIPAYSNNNRTKPLTPRPRVELLVGVSVVGDCVTGLPEGRDDGGRVGRRVGTVGLD
jgi:hypothetical protein